MNHKDELEEEMKKVWDKLSNTLNGFSYEEQAEAFFRMLSNEHRTLQQNFWRMMIKVIRKYAETKEGWYDLRNEMSVRMCRGLKVWMDDHFYTDLPTI